MIDRKLFLCGWVGFLSMCSEHRENRCFQLHARCRSKRSKEIGKREKISDLN
jgi:hypothetical protein